MLHDRLAALNKAEGTADKARARAALLASADMLGLLAGDPKHRLQRAVTRSVRVGADAYIVRGKSRSSARSKSATRREAT